MTSLYNLMEKFGLLKDTPELKEMYSNINSAENSIMIILSYDLYTYPNLSEDVINFVERKFKTKWKIGAVTLNPNAEMRMQVIQRDLPGRDIENMVLNCKIETLKESVYDLLIECCYSFPEDHTKKYQ